jgi:peptide/nickel transport system permease protein
MSALINPAPVQREPAAPISHGRMVLRRLRRNRLAMFGTVVILLLVVCAVLAPVIAPHDPVLVNPKTRLMTPGIPYLLGTDEFGRDVLSRIIYGTQISLKVGVISVGIALAAGVSLGLISGYYGGWIDHLISRVMDVFFAFPAILLAIAIMAVLGSNLTNVMIAIGIVYTPGFARVTRSAVISVRRSEYVEAAQALGATDLTIIVRHILPNSMAPIIVQTTLSLGFAILAEAALSFLGLGTEPPTPSWGLMLSTGRGFMETAPWVAIFPGVAIVLAVLSFNLLGDGLRDSLDPRLKE